MLLSLRRSPCQPWHARIVDRDARVYDFDSPIELARILCNPTIAAALAQYEPPASAIGTAPTCIARR